jgi:hypothetical protein
MPRAPRRHHFVPVAYLKAFTPSGDSSDKLFVTDSENGHTWKARPTAVGYEKDFYRSDAADDTAFEVERQLGRIESDIAPVLQRVRSERRVTPEDLNALLHFAALQAIRGLGLRRLIRDAIERDVRDMFARITESEESFLDAKALAADLGQDPFHGNLEEVRKAVADGTLKMEFNKNELLGQTLSHQAHVLNLLWQKEWALAEPAEKDLFFVTSDNPLPLAARYRPNADTFLRFELPWRDYFFPLASNLALIGGNGQPHGKLRLGRREVAVVNTFAVMASRFIFARDQGFICLRRDHAIMDGAEYAQHAQEAARHRAVNGG